MNAPFLCGMLAAWTVGLVAVGIFFCLAFAVTRRDAGYLVFGALTLTFAVVSAGICLSYGATTLGVWRVASTVAHLGAILSVPLHLHFVFRYTRARPGKAVAAAYCLALLAGSVQCTGRWWTPGTEAAYPTRCFGVEILHMTMRPTPLAVGGYVLVVVALVAASAVLLRAYRRGQREALFALVGSIGVLVGGVNDALLASGTGLPTIYLLPHAFLIYASGLSGTLLYRYRATAGELRQTASSLRETTAELRHSYTELGIMEQELVKQEQLAAVGELAASIAHEVRNPLAVIVNATASLRRPKLRESDRETLLGIVDEEATRLNALVTDLLQFARPLDPKLAPVDLRVLAEQATATVGDRYRVTIDVGEQPGRTTLHADPALLRRALDNLVENASQSMPDGGSIRITIREEVTGDRCLARVTITDDGPGMRPEVRQRALAPFFTTRSRGTGLGLPPAQRIVEAHGGEMSVESEPGTRTSIVLLLPLDRPSLVPSAKRLPRPAALEEPE
jgi:signal transduction histidine kinase